MGQGLKEEEKVVGKNREEEAGGQVGRVELEPEAEVVVVVLAEMGLVVGLVRDHCCLFHSSVGMQKDHSGLLVEERREEV